MLGPMTELEYKQMREREQAVIDRLNLNLGREDQIIESLKNAAFEALRDAERRMHKYASALDIGDDRTKAFEIFENIRNASRVGQ
jgi:hypothetical protein